MVFVTSPHTTAGITIQENADPDVRADLLAELVPRSSSFRHGEGNSDAHIKSSLMGATGALPIDGGRAVLGTWQAIYFCEFDGPRSRRVLVQILPVKVNVGTCLRSRPRASTELAMQDFAPGTSLTRYVVRRTLGSSPEWSTLLVWPRGIDVSRLVVLKVFPTPLDEARWRDAAKRGRFWWSETSPPGSCEIFEFARCGPFADQDLLPSPTRPNALPASMRAEAEELRRELTSSEVSCLSWRHT